MKHFIMFFVATSAFAQITPPIFNISRISPELQAYLELSSTQVAEIMRLNNEYFQFAAQKQLRMQQVNLEIAEWTSKEPLEPLQLGMRYVELEAIRRELRDEHIRLRPRVFAILTDPQKLRVKALDDARKLQNLASQAECHNLLEPLPDIYTGLLLGLPGSLTPGLLSGCGFGRLPTPIPLPLVP